MLSAIRREFVQESLLNDSKENRNEFCICFESNFGCASLRENAKGSLMAVCNVTSSLQMPAAEKPTEGKVNMFLDSDVLDDNDLHLVRDVFDKIFKKGLIDAESLCIITGELVCIFNIGMVYQN